MLAAMKLHFCCVLVLLFIYTNTVAPSPIDDVDDKEGTITNSSGSSASAADVGQEKVTDEDVDRFLESMKQYKSHDSFRVSQSLSEFGILNSTSQAPETSAEAVASKLDITILLAIGVASAGLLVVLAATAVAIFVCCKSGKRNKKDLSLNSDFNRWDPQLLRPTSASIDAFIFGSPIPSVAEMIKH